MGFIYFSAPNLTGVYFKLEKLKISWSEKSSMHSRNCWLMMKDFLSEKDQGLSRETNTFSKSTLSIAIFYYFRFL